MSNIYKVTRYKIYYSLLLLHPSKDQTLSSAPYYEAPSVYMHFP
jgi:hypothetical protein